MKIFSSNQMKEWDKFTITHEPVISIDLMERVAKACYNWIIKNNFDKNSFKIFCGKGNNGGDGLAIAKMLIKNSCKASVYILESGNIGSPDFQINLERLHAVTTEIHFIQAPDFFPEILENEIVIDALFGTGLNKPVEGVGAALIQHINQSKRIVIAIDVPSGLYTDKSSKESIVIKAAYTLTFQQYKLAFLMAENGEYFGKVVVLDIGLHIDFYEKEDSTFELLNIDLIKTIYRPRKQFTHKGTYGHACLVAGSIGLMGAAVLAVKACLRSGAGKVTNYTAGVGYGIIQISAPEAMTKIAGENFISNVDDIQKFDAIGIGPGLGLYEPHYVLLQKIFSDFNKPLVIDADALNILSRHKELLKTLPDECIITPHDVEFERLFGKTENDFERVNLALKKSHEYKIYIVLKGHHTLITTPYKRGYFNSTGNAGMATGGSGDVLTGLITGLLAQGYSSLEACLLGVYLHGLAGDIAAKKLSEEAMIAADIIECLGDAFKQISIFKKYV